MARAKPRLRTGREVIFNTKELAAKKSRESGVDEISWLRALESARLALKRPDFNYQTLEYIAIASRTPEHFTVVTRLIYQYTKSNTSPGQISEVILNLVNRSSFGLADWVDSISYFYNWLTANQKKIDFVPMLEYLDCCAAAPEAKKGQHTLLALLEDMIAVHGYDAG